MGAGQEVVPERAEEALPELGLTEIQKSETPINRVENQQLKIETVRPWNNYTIVTLEGSDEIIIFDENTKKVGDYIKPLSDKKIAVNWRSGVIQNKIGKRFIARDGHTFTKRDNCSISEAPLELRAFARESLKKTRDDYFELSTRFEDAEVLVGSDVIVSPDNKYILVITREGAYFAFITEDENGIALAPRNWKRVDPSQPIPPELNKYAEKILGEHEGYKQLNDKYSALITDVGINIVKNEETKDAPLFSDRVPSIERNVAVDPSNPNVIYYCQSNNPGGVVRLDLTAEPNTWGVVSAEFPKKYEGVHNLQLDPTGNFFLFYSKEDLVIVTKDRLEEVKRVSKLTHVNFDGQGRIRAIDKDGHLVVYEPNFDELAQELDKRRVARLAAGIKVADIFDLETARKEEAKKRGESLDYLQPLRAQCEEQFKEVLAKITTQEGVQQLRGGFNKLRDALKQQGLKPNEISFVIEGLEAPILEKEKEFAVKGAQEALALVRTKLASGLSIISISEARVAIESVRATEALLDTELRQEFRQVAQELEQKSVELFRQRGGEIIKDVHGLVERTKTDLEAFTSKAQMDDWLEFRYPQLKSRLGSLAHNCPLEADEAYKSITSARNQLQELATSFEEKFKREYAKIREKAAERTEGVVNTLETDIEGLIDRLRSKGFADRRAAEQYLESSDARKTLETEIMALAGNNPDIAKELERALKVRISNAITEIERGGMTQVAETGQQMILFGQTHFPKWEARVQEKVERKVDLIFNEDTKTHGPGVKAGQVFGDVAVNIRGSVGKIENVRLYEGWQDENEWRLGLLSYRGEAIPPSYVTAAEYKTIKKEYADWSQGERSKLQKELQEKRDALKEIYARRQKIGERPFVVDETGKKKYTDDVWQKEYDDKLKEYAAFVAEHHIPLLKRIDQIKAEPEIEYTNGKGFVPEWQSHWVMDPQTEADLEEMAKNLKMQLDLQEGILNLMGHAGTGKDVQVKMFCSMTNRTYFGIDCTKWMTEFELSEDVILEAEKGGFMPQTVRVPSAVLNGITTPGAVVYFNEFNAMPEQAQIFLHALMDEKRSLTLKTSSGKTIRALPSVLLAGSMNPDYPGTFKPQFATRSRMMSQWKHYPPLMRKADAGDRNPNQPYDASEALRIARGVDSLSDLTYEASLERNEFVKMWDKYVNGIENDALDPTGTQKFDIDTTLALVQFANNLRDNFIKIFEKSRDARNALPVSQPITGRELRRCAYALSKMTPEEKATANPEAVARNLLEKYFLTHIDKKEDRDKIRTAMNTWTSKKRVRA